jgi:hypothetical protein
MFARVKVSKSATVAALLLVVVACVSVSLLLVDDEQHIALSQNFQTQVAEDGNRIAENVADDIFNSDEYLGNSVLAALDNLDRESKELDMVNLQEQSSHTEAPATKRLVRYANELATHKDTDKALALIKKARNLASPSHGAKSVPGKFKRLLAKEKLRVKQLRRKIKARKLRAQMKIHKLKQRKHSMYHEDSSMYKQLSVAIRHVHSGGSVNREIKRIRQYIRQEQSDISDGEKWLYSAQPKAKSAIENQKDKIALHKKRLRKLRYFLNRIRLEKATHDFIRRGEARRGSEGVPERMTSARALSGEVGPQEEMRVTPGDDDESEGDDESKGHEDPVHHPWSYAAISGGRPVAKPMNSDKRMHKINNAMRVVHAVDPPRNAADRAAVRARIQNAVRADVSQVAAHLQEMNLGKAQEEKELRAAVQRSVIKAVSASVKEQVAATSRKPNPNYGQDYVKHEATSAASAAMVAARARGVSDAEVKRSAIMAARRASEIAIRQVAKAASEASALRAAQMAADAGQDVADQQVAASVAARVAVQQIVRDNSGLRYLNKLPKQVIPGATSQGVDAVKLAGRDVQQHIDTTQAGAVGFIPHHHHTQEVSNLPVLMGTGMEASTGVASTGMTSTIKSTPVRSPSSAATASVADDPVAAASAPIQDRTLLKLQKKAKKTEAKLQKKAQAKAKATVDKPQTEKEKALAAQVQLRAASLRAEAAMKRAQAAALAAQNAPSGPKGAKIIARAKIIAAEAARDVADARMKAEIVSTGQSPKPIIHEAASQAVQIATPIATEVATQSAALQATIQAVAAAKKIMHEENGNAVAASDAAGKVVHVADSKLKKAMRARVKKAVAHSVHRAVAKVIKQSNGKVTEEAVISAAKKAAAQEAQRIERNLLRNEIKDASVSTAAKAAAAAKAAGGNAQQVNSMKIEAKNTIRLDGEEAMHSSEDKALRAALDDAVKDSTAAKKKASMTKSDIKAAAKSAVDSAVEEISEGKDSQAISSLKHAEQDQEAGLRQATKHRSKMAKQTVNAAGSQNWIADLLGL